MDEKQKAYIEAKKIIFGYEGSSRSLEVYTRVHLAAMGFSEKIINEVIKFILQ